MAALLIGIFGAVVLYAFTDPLGALFVIAGFIVLALIAGAIEWVRETLSELLNAK